MLTYAISEAIRLDNPAHAVKRPADKKKERRLLPQGFWALGNVLDINGSGKASATVFHPSNRQ